MSKRKEKFYYRPWVLFWILIGFTFCLIGIGITCFHVRTDVQAYIVSNGLQFTNLAATITTIYFIFKNFIQQKAVITRNNDDVNHNRAIDLFYKQIEYSNKAIISTDLKRLKDVLNYLSNNTPSENRQYLVNEQVLICDISKEACRLIAPYKDILNKRNLKKKNIKYLKAILKNSLDNNLHEDIATLRHEFNKEFVIDNSVNEVRTEGFNSLTIDRWKIVLKNLEEFNKYFKEKSR